MRIPALLTLLVTLGATSVQAETRPVLDHRVNDYAKLFTTEEHQALADRLGGIEKYTTAQVVILTVPSLGGSDIETFTNDTFREAGIGQTAKDNGILLVLALAERKTRIEVGSRLEPRLTDELASEIIRNDMVPNFKKKAWAAGFMAALDKIEPLTTAEVAEPSAPQRVVKVRLTSFGMILIIFMVCIPIIVIVMLIVTHTERERREKDKARAYREQIGRERSLAAAIRQQQLREELLAAQTASMHTPASDASRARRARSTGVASSAAAGAAASTASASARRRRARDEEENREEDRRRSRSGDDDNTSRSSSSSGSDFGSSSSDSFSGGGGTSSGGGASGDF